MSTRTIIEINHDHISSGGRHSMIEDLAALLLDLCGSSVTGELNKRGPYEYESGIRILGQRHHSDPEWRQGEP